MAERITQAKLTAARKWWCNATLPNNRGAQHIAGWKPVRCEHEPGHKGNHRGRNKFGVYEWWNEADNPQKEIR